MAISHRRKVVLYVLAAIAAVIAGFLIWQLTKPIPTNVEWNDSVKLLSTADFNGHFVTIHNIRDFQYDSKGNPTVEKWYDKTYDLDKLVKSWFISVPFNPSSPFAHTFMSFEFSDGSYLAITIEARLTKDQEYGLFNGVLHTFPLTYIASDERDALYLRTNIYKDDVRLYPLKATRVQGKLMLEDMLNRMNNLAVHPRWYNGIYANCTSSIADSVNSIWPGLLPTFDWQVLFTGYVDKLALDKGLIDTTLPLEDARKKFYITDVAQKVGYASNFSKAIRKSAQEVVQ